MTTKIVKYNPSFLTDEELIEGFVVRQATLGMLLETVRDNVHETNQHLLVIGPRGSGKTTLLRRIAAAVRETQELASNWYPLAFGEESYEVASAGQFWLEALYYLGVQTGDPQWKKTYDELLDEPDEERLGLRCLARLMDFADSKGKRLLIIVENLNLILGEQVSEDDAWALRKTLMAEKRVMLLGSATTRFEAISNPKQAMFELFRITELDRLSVVECQSIWKKVAGQQISEEQARAVQILTGGNPRLLTILAAFGANRSFHSLLEDLSLLVDEHTDYFKSNFESLPSSERKVFACLATLWEDSTAAEVARTARLTTSSVSSLLKRLEGRGAVKSKEHGKGKKRYQLSERLYNVYYLMRRGHENDRIRAVVNFMIQFYGNEKLHEAVGDIVKEVCCLDADKRKYNYKALEILLSHPEVKNNFENIFKMLPKEFLELQDMPEALRAELDESNKSIAAKILALFDKSDEYYKSKNFVAAERSLRELLDIKPDFKPAFGLLGIVLFTQGKDQDEGLAYLRRSVVFEPESAINWTALGMALYKPFGEFEEAAECLKKAIKISPTSFAPLKVLAELLILHLNSVEEGVDCLKKALDIDSTDENLWSNYGATLALRLHRYEEGLEVFNKAVKIYPLKAFIWKMLGVIHAVYLNQIDHSEPYLRKAVELDPNDRESLLLLGTVLALKKRYVEAESYLQHAYTIDPSSGKGIDLLSSVLTMAGKLDEAEEYRRKAIALEPENENFMNSLAVLLSKKRESLEEAESLVREALSIKDDTYFHGTLSLILALQGRVDEALQQAEIILQHPDVVHSDIQEPTDVLCIAAALERGREALELLEKSPSLAHLEPLAAGLRQYLGLEVKAPQEVKEISDDIVKRIAYWKEWHQQRVAAS